MKYIHTILGRLASDQLGLTDCHNHLFIEGGIPVLHFPDFRLIDYGRIKEDCITFMGKGGKAIVEMSPIDWGRNISLMIQLAQELGLHIISATGFHKVFYYSDIHWIYKYSEDELVKLIYDELMEGIDIYNYSGPIVKRTTATAGVIKVGTQTGSFSKIEEKLLSVVARVHQITGAPIITHTDEGALALEQINYLSKLGVSPTSIGISHIDRHQDLSYHKDVASTGAYLEYDALTRVNKGYDNTTLKLIISMVEAGFKNNIILGGDISRQSYWKSYGGEPGLDFLAGEFRNRLFASGLTENDINCLYVNNPRSLLAW